MSEQTAQIHDEFIVVDRAQHPKTFPAFIDELLEGYNILEAASLQPSFIVFGNGRIVNIRTEERQIDSSTGYREGKRITFTYRLPEDKQLITEHLMPLTRQYFGGCMGDAYSGRETQ